MVSLEKATGRHRTGNLRFTKPLLRLLSYRGIPLKSGIDGDRTRASSVTGKRSCQLSYDTIRTAEACARRTSRVDAIVSAVYAAIRVFQIKPNKAADGSRTRDRPPTKRVLSRPSSGSTCQRELTREGSNLLPPAYQAGALPVSYGSNINSKRSAPPPDCDGARDELIHLSALDLSMNTRP